MKYGILSFMTREKAHLPLQSLKDMSVSSSVRHLADGP